MAKGIAPARRAACKLDLIPGRWTLYGRLHVLRRCTWPRQPWAPFSATSAAPAAAPGRRAERRSTAGQLSARAQRERLRRPAVAARADGPRPLPPAAGRPARRRRRLSGHVPRPRAPGRRHPPARLAGELAVRRGPAHGPAGEARRGPPSAARRTGRGGAVAAGVRRAGLARPAGRPRRGDRRTARGVPSTPSSFATSKGRPTPRRRRRLRIPLGSLSKRLARAPGCSAGACCAAG